MSAISWRHVSVFAVLTPEAAGRNLGRVLLSVWRRVGITGVAFALGASPGLGRDLPHRLHIEPYFQGGLQVQVIVDFILSRDECRRLVKMYRPRAKGGQVAVMRPITSKDRGKGPWCRDNFDGRGIVFNDDLFDWEVYSGIEASAELPVVSLHPAVGG